MADYSKAVVLWDEPDDPTLPVKELTLQDRLDTNGGDRVRVRFEIAVEQGFLPGDVLDVSSSAEGDKVLEEVDRKVDEYLRMKGWA